MPMMVDMFGLFFKFFWFLFWFLFAVCLGCGLLWKRIAVAGGDVGCVFGKIVGKGLKEGLEVGLLCV